MRRLDGNEIESSLRELPAWTKSGETIVRELELPDFAAALALVNRVGAVAEAANHHPDIDIRWNKVRLTLSSHDAGGLTERDLRMAAKIDALPQVQEAKPARI